MAAGTSSEVLSLVWEADSPEDLTSLEIPPNPQTTSLFTPSEALSLMLATALGETEKSDLSSFSRQRMCAASRILQPLETKDRKIA